MLVQGLLNWFYRILGRTGAPDLTSVCPSEPPRPFFSDDAVRSARVPIRPENLSKMADDHDARQVQAEDEQYKDFLATGYPSLLTWVAHLLDKEAVNGGRHLDLSFDHWAGRVDGIGLGLMRAGDYFKALESRQYSLPFSRTAIRIEVLADKLAGAVADHFRKLGFA